MYTIRLHKRVIKFIENRTQKEKERIRKKLLILQHNPYPNNLEADVKKLKNRAGFRLRVGDYRFIYEVKEDELIIYMEKADNRGDIY